MTGATLFYLVVVAGALLVAIFWAAKATKPDAESQGPVLSFFEEQFSTGAASRPGGASRDAFLEFFVVAASVLLALASLREYLSGTVHVAAPDYVAEALPALAGLKAHGLSGYLDHLPGYPGAMMVQLIPAELSNLFGLSEAATWRVLSCFGISALALALLAALPLLRVSEASRGSARTAILLAAASPAAYWALRIGHPEEVLSTGLLLGAVIAAAKEKPIVAGLLLGLAIGKAWPAVAALPVLGLLLPSFGRFIKGGVAALVAIAVIYLPSLLFAGSAVKVMSTLGQQGIFNVGQVWWWFGTPLPASVVRDPAQQVVPQPRGLGPSWTGEISHPLILGVGVAIGVIWCWTLYQRLAGGNSVSALRAALRSDGNTRSPEDAARLAGAALLVMAGILYARCFLDTWNVPYYLLPAFALGAMGEVLTGRRPILTLVATGIWWKWHQPGDPTVRTSPDVYTAMYLAWTIPFCLTFLKLGFGALQAAEPAATTDQAPPAATEPNTLAAAG